MSKIMFIPKWLKDDLLPNQMTQFEKNFSSTIRSEGDVINYHKAQWQFLKFLTDCQYSTDDLYSMYQELFVHPFPENVQLRVFLKQDDHTTIVWDDMSAGVGTRDKMRFQCTDNTLGTALYVVGYTAEESNDSTMLTADAHMLVSELLSIQHKGLRIEGRGTDKSSAFRELPLLTQLYVSYKF